MHDCYSTTHINHTPQQAWRAGFREGVKLCTRNGEPPPAADKFSEWVWKRNLENLMIWYTVGRDVENGFWSILGARTGTHYLMFRDWDHTAVRDFGMLDELWEKHQHDDEKIAAELGEELNRRLGLDIVELSPATSSFFKNRIAKRSNNLGIMVDEMSVIRREEGW
jgi:hypothetical protein